jgi:hypothetical protein
MSVAACEPGAAVPEGAQVVHVSVTDTGVTLEPASVRAGDVYLALDEPPGGSIAFVARQDTANATPGPLTEADLARLRNGDTIHTAIVGLDAGGCSPAQDAQARGRMGPCGNVLQLVVTPGRYAVVGGAPERDPVTGRVSPMAVLTVTP